MLRKRHAKSTFLLFGLVTSSCKFDFGSGHNSKLSADGTREINETGAFFKASWDQDFIVKYSDLPTAGTADMIPYSGHWYPESNGGTNVRANPGGSALEKYDEAFYKGANRAALWETRNHGTGATDWAGHCNGFSAASARHREPLSPVVRNGVTFAPGDIKALLAEIYMSANYFFLGGMRCESASDTAPNPDLDRSTPSAMGECEDVNPGTFHVSMANWIGRERRPLVFDEARHNQVWNYPMFEYTSTSREVSPAEALQVIGSRNTTYVFNENAKTLIRVATTVAYADALPVERVPAGTIRATIPLEYILELNADGQVIGGEWSFSSRNTHPDFIWAPLEPMQGQDNRSSGNPYLDVGEVLKMWAESAGYSSLAAAPKQLESGSWASTWGQFDNFRVSIDGGRRGSVLYSDGGNQLLIARNAGAPKVAVTLNSDVVPEHSDKDNIQAFTISPVVGINWADLSYSDGDTQTTRTLLMNVIE